MASSLLVHLQERQVSLLQALITRIFDLQPEDANFNTVLEYATRHLSPKYHSFPTVQPAKVNECYTDLEERLTEHAQSTKVQALGFFRWRLCQLQLQGAGPDLDWSILSLLFSLATRPLDTQYPPPQPQTPHPAPQHPAEPYPGPSHPDPEPGAGSGDGCSSETEPDDAWDSASSLSDWSSPDTEPDQEIHAGPTDQPMQPGPQPQQEPSRMQAHAGTSTWSRMAAALRALEPPSSPQLPGSCIGPARAAAPSAADLVQQLQGARLGMRRPLGALRAEDCCSDGYLVHQALLLLLGCQSQAFEWQARPGRFLPRRGLHVAYLSPTQLQAVLGRFAEAGTQVHLLRGLSSLPPGDPLLHLPGAMHSSSAPSPHSPRPAGPRAVLATPCLRAYLTAMHAQLQRLMQPLVAMQQANMHAATATSTAPNPSQPRPFTLLELLDLTQSSLHRIQLLYLSTRAVTEALPSIPSTQALDPQSSPRSASGPSHQASPRGSAAPKTRLLSPGAKGKGAAAAAAPPASRLPPPPVNKAAASSAAAAAAAAAALQKGDAARTSTVLLDVLFQQLQQFGPLGGPANCSDHQYACTCLSLRKQYNSVPVWACQVLLYLYLCTLVPLLEGLQSWLYNSDGQSLSHDFFIRAADRNVSETDPSYWSSAYTLVQQQQQQQQREGGVEGGVQGGAPGGADSSQAKGPEPGGRQSTGSGAGPAEQAPAAACPSYLQPMAPSILAAGKLLRLLRSSARQSAQPASRPSASARAPAAGPSTPRAALSRSLLQDQSPGDGPALRRAPHPGGGGRSGDSLSQSFLDNLHSYLSAYNSPATQQRTPPPTPPPPGSSQAAPAREAGPWHPSPELQAAGAAGRSSSSYFALMAMAGESLGRLEPWLAGPGPSFSRGGGGGGGGGGGYKAGQGARELPPPPAVPWLPPWLPPSEQWGPAAWERGDVLSLQDRAWGSSGAGREEAAAGQLPSAPLDLGGAAGAEGVADAGEAAPAAAAMSTDGSVADLQEVVGMYEGRVGGQEVGDGPEPMHQDDEPGAAPGVEGPGVCRGDGDGQYVPGLEEWGRQVGSGLCRRGRLGGWGGLQGGGGMGKWGTFATGGGRELERLHASLLPLSSKQAGEQQGKARRGVREQGGAAQWELLAAPSQQQVLHRMAWLLEGGGLRLPPIQMLLQRCLLPLLSRRVEALNRRLLRCLLSDWGLQAELLQLRNFYLLASPAMQAWAGWLLAALLRGKMVEECQEHELETALQEAVAACASESDAACALPPLDAMSVTIDVKRAARARDKQVEATRRSAATFAAAHGAEPRGIHPSERKQNHCLAELDGLQLRCQPSWLLAMIGGDEAMESYGQAMVFLLQIQLAKMAMEATRQRCWKLFQRQARWGGGTRGQAANAGVLGVLYGPAAPRAPQRPGGGGGGAGSAVLLGQRDEEAVQQEMVNFVTNLHQFILDRLLLNAWVHLERGLHQVRSLDEVAALHRQFVADLDQQCGRSGAAGSTQKHISAAIIRVLDQVVRFCSAHKNAAEAAEALAETSAAAASSVAAAAAGASRRSGGLMTRSQLQLQDQLSTARKIMADAASQFKQLLLYLLRILHAAALKARSRTEFEHLLSSINHNGFYDSQLLLPE